MGGGGQNTKTREKAPRKRWTCPFNSFKSETGKGGGAQIIFIRDKTQLFFLLIRFRRWLQKQSQRRKHELLTSCE